MAGLFFDDGRKAVLDILFDASRSPKARLFTNNFALTQTKVFGDFTEPTFTGYATIDLSTMAAAIINGMDQGQKIINPASWACTANGAAFTCYGYLITITDLSAAQRVFFADKFPGPVVVQNNGDAISLPLTFLSELGT